MQGNWGLKSRKPEGLKKDGLVALSVNTEYTQNKYRKQARCLPSGYTNVLTDFVDFGRLLSDENIPESKIEFIAKTTTDPGKAIFIVGLASYFFEKFPLVWRVGITTLSIMFIFAGIVIYPEKRGEE